MHSTRAGADNRENFSTSRLHFGAVFCKMKSDGTPPPSPRARRVAALSQVSERRREKAFACPKGERKFAALRGLPPPRGPVRRPMRRTPREGVNSRSPFFSILCRAPPRHLSRRRFAHFRTAPLPRSGVSLRNTKKRTEQIARSLGTDAGKAPAKNYLPKYLLRRPLKPAPWRASSFAISCTVSWMAS